jgi:hypothetical protein
MAAVTAELSLFSGALGQLGSELTRVLHAKYGLDSVIASDIRIPPIDSPVNKGAELSPRVSHVIVAQARSPMPMSRTTI